ncbi:hypothetical protein PENTCL1PPCAC_21684, partial [Pristionchus entomophagus]
TALFYIALVILLSEVPRAACDDDNFDYANAATLGDLRYWLRTGFRTYQADMNAWRNRHNYQYQQPQRVRRIWDCYWHHYKSTDGHWAYECSITGYQPY